MIFLNLLTKFIGHYQFLNLFPSAVDILVIWKKHPFARIYRFGMVWYACPNPIYLRTMTFGWLSSTIRHVVIFFIINKVFHT